MRGRIQGNRGKSVQKRQKRRTGRQVLFWDRFLDLLYPPRCPICGRIPDTGLICTACEDSLRYIDRHYCMKCGSPLEDSRAEYCEDCVRIPHAFDQGRSLLSYQGAVRQSLYRLKYANCREYARFYAAGICSRLGDFIQTREITVLVPVPLHPVRQRQRGYNQAALLAERIGAELGIPMEEGLLLRIKPTVPQKQLNGRQRKTNLDRAFRAGRKIQPGERILIIDDIYTTGATADAAAAALQEAGARSVYVITAAIGG
jgi:ComF family protein